MRVHVTVNSLFSSLTSRRISNHSTRLSVPGLNPMSSPNFHSTIRNRPAPIANDDVTYAGTTTFESCSIGRGRRSGSRLKLPRSLYANGNHDSVRSIVAWMETWPATSAFPLDYTSTVDLACPSQTSKSEELDLKAPNRAPAALQDLNNDNTTCEKTTTSFSDSYEFCRETPIFTRPKASESVEPRDVVSF